MIMDKTGFLYGLTAEEWLTALRNWESYWKEKENDINNNTLPQQA